MYIQQQLIKIWRCLYPVLIYILAQQLVLSLIVPLYFRYTMAEASDASLSAVQMTVQNYLNTHTVALTTLSAVIALPLLLTFYLSDRKKSRIIVLKNKHLSWQYIFVILAAVCSSITLSFITTLLSLSEKIESYRHVNDILFNEPLVIQLIGTGLIVPVTEELIFRGLIQNRIRTCTGSGFKAIILTGIFFGIFHENIVQATAAAAAGILISYIYEKSGNLFAPVIFHICFNLPGILMQYMNFTLNTDVMMITAAACLAITLFIVYLFQRRFTPDRIMSNFAKR